MTSLYKITYYGFEQHITMALPAWRCLFTERNTWLYSTLLLCMRACGQVVWLSLRMANVPGSRRTQYSVVSAIFIYCLQCFVLSLSFPTMANISIIYFSFTLTFSYNFLLPIFTFAKIIMHIKISEICVSCYWER